MKITVLYFGVLAEVAGKSFGVVENVGSFDDLKQRLFDDTPALQHYNFRFSLNSLLVTGNPELKENDEVALLPPFAGG
jgi:sulfur-carrier protein